MTTTIRVALVDEYDVVRAGVQTWLAAEPTTSVVAEFSALPDCLAWLQSSPSVDVLVTEIQHGGHAPDFDGLRRLCQAGPPVVVYGRALSDEVLLGSVEAGAVSYVGKAEGREHLVAAVTAAGAGLRYVAPRLSDALEPRASVVRITLSEREKEVLVGWLKTESKDDVAHALHISPATVRTHLQRIRIKYDQADRRAPTKSDLLARAIEDGLLGLADLGVATDIPESLL